MAPQSLQCLLFGPLRKCLPCTRLWVSLPSCQWFLTAWRGLCTYVFSGHLPGVRRALLRGSPYSWSLFFSVTWGQLEGSQRPHLKSRG